MFMALSAFGKILFVSSGCAVALSICIGVRGCGWPSLISVCRIEMAVFTLIKRAPSSASAADDMTTQIFCEVLRTARFFMGILSFPAVNMWPPASSAAAGFGLGEVRRVAVDCEDHVARLVGGEYSFFLC